MRLKDYKELKRQVKNKEQGLKIHRFLYYVKHDPLIDDLEYDRRERELEALYTRIRSTPSAESVLNTVGSSNPKEYSDRIASIATRLLRYRNKSSQTI